MPCPWRQMADHREDPALQQRSDIYALKKSPEAWGLHGEGSQSKTGGREALRREPEAGTSWNQELQDHPPKRDRD